MAASIDEFVLFFMLPKLCENSHGIVELSSTSELTLFMIKFALIILLMFTFEGGTRLSFITHLFYYFYLDRC